MKMTVDSRQLSAFSALARCGSFTLAARELFLTQSAVSHAIKALEDDLGTRLVDRIGKRIRLTPAGEQFLRHTENILREMQSARIELDSVSRWGHNRLRVGASTTACQHLLPTVLREFRESFPKCVIKIESGDHGRQLELLRAGHVDLAFLLEPNSEISEDLVFVPLFEDELRFFVAPQHPWAQMRSVPFDELGTETLILYNKSSYTFRLVAGILAPWIATSELANGTLVSLPLGQKRLRRQWSVAYWKGRRLALAEETFVGLCETVAKNLGAAELKAAG
jgi:LysR family transcriptional regulator, low CO2-responsive transcriptional regulator